MSAPGPTSAEALLLHLALIAGPEPAGWLEFRNRKTNGCGWGQMFHPAARPASVIDTVLRGGRNTDYYVGAAPRAERRGGRNAIARAWALWVDCDDADAVERLHSFEPAPSLILSTGREDGAHGWWSLREPLCADHLERALRRLADHLGADPACTDAARVLRPAGTYTHKRGTTPRLLVVRRLEPLSYTAREVVGHLPDPPAPAPRPPRRVQTSPGAGADVLRSIPASVYVPLLLGRELGRDGKVTCPFHDDRTPSLHAYDDPDRGWTCFGCGAGGSIIDFASRLWDIPTRGRDYHDLRRRLAAELLRAAA